VFQGAGEASSRAGGRAKGTKVALEGRPGGLDASVDATGNKRLELPRVGSWWARGVGGMFYAPRFKETLPAAKRRM
jgi:hypothetical protein